MTRKKKQEGVNWEHERVKKKNSSIRLETQFGNPGRDDARGDEKKRKNTARISIKKKKRVATD